MPPVLPPEALRPYRGRLWRMIEGQYRPATVRIVDTDAEQTVLERILEDSKPPVPPECQHLDYQFWSPFRYGRYPRASRFRRAGRSPGVWYGSQEVLTAVIESLWGTLRFFAASPDTPLPRHPVTQTAVAAEIATPFCADLTAPPLLGAGDWTNPDEYGACLDLADELRAARAEAIRYMSVRDPQARANVAVLSCAAFEAPAPVASQTWHLLLRPGRLRAHCETTRARHMFEIGATGLILA